MPGKQLARWTLAWFAVALAFLLVALAALVAGHGGPGGWQDGHGLGVVHVLALGWQGHMMLGALIQFVPVLVARPLALPGLALPALALSALGTVGLAAGFARMEPWLLTLAPLALGAGFALVVAMLGGTLVAARGWRSAAGRTLIPALAALALTWVSGGAMAVMLAGYDAGLPVTETLPFHILAGLGGWLSLAAFATSYKLFSMFLLAPETSGPARRGTLAAALAALALIAAGLAAALAGVALPLIVPALAASIAAALYLADIRGLWRARRRPQPEVNMTMTRQALAFLGLCAVLAPFAALWGGRWAEAAIAAALAGWLSTLTLAQMVKIVSFLTWIQVFSSRIGRGEVPMVHQLTDARMTRLWLRLWSAGVLAAVLSLLAQAEVPFRLAALALFVAAVGLAVELVAIRRLTHLADGMRPSHLPPLILPSSSFSDRSRLDDQSRPARA